MKFVIRPDMVPSPNKHEADIVLTAESDQERALLALLYGARIKGRVLYEGSLYIEFVV